MAALPRQGIMDRFESYRPTKVVTFWTCAVCVVATMVIGFNWGGWVTGGTATTQARNAADTARTQLVAAGCVVQFGLGADAAERLASLNKAESWSRATIIEKGGWALLPGMKEPVSAPRISAARQIPVVAS